MQKLVFVGFPIDDQKLYKVLEDEEFKVIYGRKPSSPIASEKETYSEDEIIERCREVHAIIASPRLKLSPKALRSMQKLVCICQRGIGFDNVDIETASELGILVTNAPIELDFISVAEHTLALILALAKKLKNISMLMSQKDASIYYDERVDTITLKDKTVGIIGLGRIGAKVATLLHPFNVKLLGYDPYISEQKAKSFGVQLVELSALLRESDFVTIHVPLTKQTYHLIGVRELDLMKKTAYIINTSRGAVIDENALIDALKNRRIAGAALDVLEKEPVTPDNPLLTMDNVIVTPHIAGRNSESLIEGEKVAVDNCVKLLKGVVPEYVINPEAIPKWREKCQRF
ncbi:MAG: hydroxyacid dehydrogenase [Candidatus Bathyarchaeia archaeon]